MTSLMLLSVMAFTPAAAQAALTAGGPWVPSVSGLAIVNDTTWLVSGGLEVSRTADAGQAWRTSAAANAGAPDGPSWITGVAASGGVAFAAGYWAPPEGGAAGQPAISFGTSADGGATWKWTKVSESLSLPKLVADPANPSRLLLYGARLAGGGMMMGSAQYAAFASDDRGATWREVGGLPALGVAIYAGGDGTLYAGMNRSTDWGASWQPIASADAGGVPLSGMTISPVPYGASGLVAGAQAHDGTGFKAGTDLLFSDNRGDSWTRVTAGLPVFAGVPIIAAGPDGQVVVIGNGETRIVRRDGSTAAAFPERELQATGQAGVAGGATVIPTNGGVVVVSGAGSENRSTGIPSYGTVEQLAVSPANAGTMLAETPSGLYRSADGGASWSSLGNRSAVAFNPRTAVVGAVHQAYETTEAGTGLAGRLEVSADGGATWTPGASLGSGQNGLLPQSPIAWAGEARAYIVLSSNSGYALGRSDDRLATIATLPLPASPASTVVASADNPDLVFLSASAGVFRSTDAGATWASIRIPGGMGMGGTAGNLRVAISAGAKPTIVLWAVGQTKTCSSTNLGASFTCSPIPYYPITSGRTTYQAQIRTLGYQADGTIAATIGQNPANTNQNIASSQVIRSADNGQTWATTEGMAALVPLAAVDITGKGGRKGKKSAAGTRRFALASTGVIRQSLTFALLAAPSLTTTGIKVSRAGGGKVTLPIGCEKGRRCSGTIEGNVNVGGKSVKLALTRFSILGPKGVAVGIASASQKTFKALRGAGTISLRMSYTDPTGKRRTPRVTAKGAITLP